ncbi:MAG: hypothetical protein NT120_01455 [Candidatus Aenigmarchaeota archaeon]|nr:hypothetical protein [Candidatus Aenigmarchaeota archaeon]
MKKEDFLKIAILIFCLVVASFFLPGKITGKAGDAGVDVSVLSRIGMEITFFDYYPVINLSDYQNISVEIMNSGSEDYDARITEFIYNLSGNATLNLSAEYADSSVHLYPGNTRSHIAIYYPPAPGQYFIKLSIRYGGRLSEVWGSFVVLAPPPPPPPGGGGGGGGAGGGGGGGQGAGQGQIGGLQPLPNQFSISTDISLDYPQKIIVYKNITYLMGIKVTNVGKYYIDRMTLHTSIPSTFEIDANPKAEQTLNRNSSLIYLVSINSRNTDVGQYKLDFQVTSYYTKKDGSTVVEVQEVPQFLKDMILNNILNYDFLITEISGEIESAANKGYDMSTPNSYINSAIENLNKTKRYYNFGEYDNALKQMERVDEDLKQSVFTLGNITMNIYAYPVVSYYYIILFIIPILIIAFLLYKKSKKKNKRPKILERSKEES